MFKDKSFTVLCVLISVLLVINWFTWSTIRETQQRIEWLQGNLNSLHSNITSEVSGVRHVVQQLKNDARWWTPAEVDFLDVDRDKAQVKISWSLREYKDGSQVMLNYQKPGEQEYTQIVPREESMGRFSVVLPVDVPREPVINLSVEKVRGHKNLAANTAVEEKSVSDTVNENLMYYISVQDGDTIRTSETQSLNLKGLNYKLFSPLMVRVRLMDNGEITVSAHHDLMGNPRYDIEEIYLETRQGNGNVLERWPLDNEKIPEEGIYHLNVTTTEDYETLYLVVKYSGGLKVEREIM